MTNRYVNRLAQFFSRKSALLSLILAALTSGCATNRPGTILIEHPVKAMNPGPLEVQSSFKLVTYNVWGLPSWMTGAPPGRYPRIARELERLDPDIILLQEAWTSKARRALPTNGLWSIARAADQRGFFRQCGLVTLSKFPIVSGAFYPFSREAIPDCFVNKGILKITLQLPNGRLLNIWNVHLQSGGPPAILESQVREVIARVQAALDDQIADVVGGDFNTTPESPLYRELETALGPNVQQLCGEKPFVTWEGFSGRPGAGRVLDHVFLRGRRGFEPLHASQCVAFAAARGEQRLSDHFGVQTAVTLSLGSPFAIVAAPERPDPQMSAIRLAEMPVQGPYVRRTSTSMTSAPVRTLRLE